MQITVRLYATLRKYHPLAADPSSNAGFPLVLEAGTTLRDVVETCLAIPTQTVKMLFVNGAARADSYVLQDGDEMGVFPPVAGGAGAGIDRRR